MAALQVKSLVAASPDELADAINDFITAEGENILVEEIQFITPIVAHCYGAYIIYSQG